MLKPGTSCLFMIVEKITPDKAIAALSKYGGTVRKTSLSGEDTNKLPQELHGWPPQPPDEIGYAGVLFGYSGSLILAQLLVGAPHPNRHRLRLEIVMLMGGLY